MAHTPHEAEDDDAEAEVAMTVFGQFVEAFWHGFIIGTIGTLLCGAGWLLIRAAARRRREKEEDSFAVEKYLAKQAKEWRVQLRELVAQGPLIVYNIVQDTIAFAIADDFFAAVKGGYGNVSTPAGIKVRVAWTITCAYKYRQIPIQSAVQHIGGLLLHRGGIPLGAEPEAEAAIFSKETNLFVPLGSDDIIVWTHPSQVWKHLSDKVHEEMALRDCLSSPNTTIS